VKKQQFQESYSENALVFQLNNCNKTSRSVYQNHQMTTKTIHRTLSIERNPFPAKNKILQTIYFAYEVGIISS